MSVRIFLSASLLPGCTRGVSLWPRRTGVCLGSPCSGTYVSIADGVGLCHEVVAASRSDQGLFKTHCSLSRPCAHTACTYQTRLGPLGSLNEVRLHCFLALPFGSPFILLPFTYTLFHFFFHVFLSSCLGLAPDFSLLRTHWSGP